MRDGPRGFGQDFSCPGLLRCRLARPSVFAYGAFTLCGPAFQPVRLTSGRRFADGPTTPDGASLPLRFGLVRFRSPLLAQSLLFSLPPGNEMFQFPGFAPDFVRCRSRLRRVAPFGNPRIDGYLPLRAAYRSLSRPSSPPRAKASFMRPSLLSLDLCLLQVRLRLFAYLGRKSRRDLLPRRYSRFDSQVFSFDLLV